MRTACLLAALCVVAVSGANLRQLPEPDPNYNETLGNDGGPDGLGVQPKMVPVGHFSLNKYAAKLGEMTQKGMKFRPLLVPPGHFSGVAPPEPSTTDPIDGKLDLSEFDKEVRGRRQRARMHASGERACL